MDLRDVQVVKDGPTFFMSDDFGDAPRGNHAALGLYHRDTRFLSLFELAVNEIKPILLHSSTERNYSQVIELSLPVPVEVDGHLRVDHVSLHRSRVISGSLYERIRIRNYGLRRQTLRMTLDFAADFLDIFEVRGIQRERRGQLQPPRVVRHEVVLAHRGLDGTVRTTTVRFSPMPRELTESRATFEVILDEGEEAEVAVEVVPVDGEADPDRRTMREAEERLVQEYMAWRKRCTRFRSPNAQLTSFLDRAVQDLRMLVSTTDDGWRFLDAGVPWFSALFGRDSLITAYQALGVMPDVAWGTLRGLAGLQGTKDDDWREEEPGKILHEVRVGELARAGEIPHTPYYGTVDATPLWLILLGAAYRWTGDLDAVRELWPAALECLRWIDEHGDLDGDGFVEYRRRSPRGLENQGWKDSWDAVLFPDGTLAEPPIALVEVQGYVYHAKTAVAVLARHLQEHAVAERLEREAAELRRRFHEAFWMPGEGYFALALDGNKRQVPTITSNPGHCLWSRIVDPELAPRVVHRLMSSALSSGWGIRTLASGQPAYDPIGYHIGTVWPHDTTLIAHGMKRYGFDREATAVLDQLTRAGTYFPYARFPELFCGYASDEVPVPVQYPVACRPQAWASGAPLLMIRSYGGISADAHNRRVFIVRPRLPAWLEQIELVGLRIGRSRLDLTFTSHGGVTAVQVPRKEGDVEVFIRQ